MRSPGYLACLAVLALVSAPVLATDESAQKKPAEKTDTAKPAESAKKSAEDTAKPATAPAAGGTAAAKADDETQCEPAAARVNTLEDLFGARNWLFGQARTAAPTAEPIVEWRETAPAPAPTPAEPAPAKPGDAK